MTTNEKGNMGESSLGMQKNEEEFNTRANHQTYTPSVSDGEEKTLARQV